MASRYELAPPNYKAHLLPLPLFFFFFFHICFTLALVLVPYSSFPILFYCFICPPSPSIRFLPSPLLLRCCFHGVLAVRKEDKRVYWAWWSYLIWQAGDRNKWNEAKNPLLMFLKQFHTAEIFVFASDEALIMSSVDLNEESCHIVLLTLTESNQLSP